MADAHTTNDIHDQSRTTSEESVLFNIHEHNEEEEVEQIEMSSRAEMIPPDESTDQKLSYKILTYLRQNYLIIIKALFSIILLLIGIIIVLLLFQIIHADSANIESKTPVIGEKSEVPRAQATVSPHEMTVTGISCSRINCKTALAPCVPTSVNYFNIRKYVCCECAPYRMIRYEEHGNSIRVYFEYTSDACLLGKYDLLSIDKLNNLKGEWIVVREAETKCWLVYAGVEVDPPQMEDEAVNQQEAVNQH